MKQFMFLIYIAFKIQKSKELNLLSLKLTADGKFITTFGVRRVKELIGKVPWLFVQENFNENKRNIKL